MNNPENRADNARTNPPPQSTVPDYWWKSVLTVALGLFFGVILLAALWLLAQPIALVILGIAIAAALAPLVNRLEGRLPRVLAVVLLFLFWILVLVGIGWIVIPPLALQAQAIAIQMPDLLDEVERIIEQIAFLRNIDLEDLILPEVGRIGSALLAVPLGLFSGLVAVLVVLFVSLYLLVEAPKIRSFFLSLFPRTDRDLVDSLLNDMAQAMGGYIRGTVITATLVGVFMYLGLLIIGIEFPLVLGLLAGVMEFIPYLGPFIAGVPIVTIALLQSPTQALIVLIYVVVLQQVESYILVPFVMRTQTKVSPLLVLVAILVGSSLAGLLGVFIAIPVAAAGRVFTQRVIAPWIRRQTGAPPSGDEIEENPVEGEEERV